MKFFVTGLSFKTAPVALREQLTVAPADQARKALELKEVGGLDQIVLLWTCNRVEIYGVAPKLNGNLKVLLDHLTDHDLELDLNSQVYTHEEDAALNHLFAVAGGLDSMVLGEPEITGQIKNAYETALRAGLTGRQSNQAFQKALQTAKAIRTDTRIGKGAASVGSVCVTRAERIFSSNLSHKTILVIGAGKMAETCVRHFYKKGARSIIVSNRSYDRAEQLAAEFQGRAVHFDQLPQAMIEADVVVTSTSCPKTIIHPEDLAPVISARNERPLFMIDIAVPRDIDPRVGEMDGVYLDDIDDLQKTVHANVQHRKNDLDQCQLIIREKIDELNEAIARGRAARNQPRVSAPAGALLTLCTSFEQGGALRN